MQPATGRIGGRFLRCCSSGKERAHEEQPTLRKESSGVQLVDIAIKGLG